MEYQLDTSLAPERWRSLDRFTQGYIKAAMWTLTDDDGCPLDELGLHDIADQTIEQAIADCRDFRESNETYLDETDAGDAQHGHDFWLTRNRHGAGFWDRGYGETGRILTASAHAYGSVDWYVGDDGLVYQN